MIVGGNSIVRYLVSRGVIMLAGFGAGKERERERERFCTLYLRLELDYLSCFFFGIKGSYKSEERVAKYEETIKAVNNQKLYAYIVSVLNPLMHANHLLCFQIDNEAWDILAQQQALLTKDFSKKS